ncbi:unnamed protein product, partial [marine sediment metagenome]
DYLVDGAGVAWLLEVNAFPDFKQSGEEQTELIRGLFEGIVEVAVRPFFELAKEEEEVDRTGRDARMVKVLDVDLGRR